MRAPAEAGIRGSSNGGSSMGEAWHSGDLAVIASPACDRPVFEKDSPRPSEPPHGYDRPGVAPTAWCSNMPARISGSPSRVRTGYLRQASLRAELIGEMAEQQVPLSTREARRIALAAQGLLGPRISGGPPGLLGRTRAVQLDTISVLARSHELVTFARLGPIGACPDRGGLLGAEERDLRVLVARGLHPPARGLAHLRLPAPGSHRPGPTLAPTSRTPTRAARMSATVSGPKVPCRPVSSEAQKRAAPGGTGARPRSRPNGSWTQESSSAASARASSASTTWPSAPSRPSFSAPSSATRRARSASSDGGRRALGVATASDLAAYHGLNAPPGRASRSKRPTCVPAAVEGWDAAGLCRPRARSRCSSGGCGAARCSSPPSTRSPGTGRGPSASSDSAIASRPMSPVPKRLHGYFSMPVLGGDRLVGLVDPGRSRDDPRRQACLLDTKDAAAHVAAALVEAARWVGSDDIVVERVTPEERTSESWPRWSRPLRAERAAPRPGPSPGRHPGRPSGSPSPAAAAFTGVETWCRRPRSTISPFSQSASMLPVWRARLCHEEPPDRSWPATEPVGTDGRPALGVELGGRHLDPGRLEAGRSPRPGRGATAARAASVSTACRAAASMALPRLESSLRYLRAITFGSAIESKVLSFRSAAICSLTSSTPLG